MGRGGKGGKARSTGTAGASARREHERRSRNSERRTREKHPLIGGLLVALRDERQHQRAWASGAMGEEAVARTLDARCAQAVCLLHDRRIPGSRANIDHIAVAPTGVWVVDAKRYKGRIQVRKPLFGEARLTIGRRDRSKLADGLARQVAAVEAVVGADVPVRGALCFVEGDLSRFGTPTFRGYALLHRRKLARKLNAAGPIPDERVRELAALLAERLPAA